MLSATPWMFVIIWSTGFIVARYGMPHAPPMKFLALRYLLSLACFLLWIAARRVSWPVSRDQWMHLAIAGVLMHAGYLGGVWSAVKAGMGSGLAALIVGLQPVLTAVWMAHGGGHVTSRQWAGLALGFCGLALVVLSKFGLAGEANLLNVSFAATALLSITAGTLYQKRFVAPCDVRTGNAVQLTAAFVITLPLALLESQPMHWEPALMGAMTWSVLGLTLGGSSLLFLLIQQGAATSVTSLLYLVPPTTAMFAFLLFGEPVTVPMVFGTALAVAGVRLVVKTG